MADPCVQQIQVHVRGLACLLSPSSLTPSAQIPFKFADPESQALAMQAIMHSSASGVTNNVDLSRVG